MSWKKGYAEEYLAKKILVKRFGKLGVIKIAIAQFGADFLCFQQGKLVLAVEVKACHGRRYYPKEKERLQFKRIAEFCKEHDCIGELWIKYPHKPFEVRALWP